jgi:hypothetical protein
MTVTSGLSSQQACGDSVPKIQCVKVLSYLELRVERQIQLVWCNEAVGYRRSCRALPRRVCEAAPEVAYLPVCTYTMNDIVLRAMYDHRSRSREPKNPRN